MCVCVRFNPFTLYTLFVIEFWCISEKSRSQDKSYFVKFKRDNIFLKKTQELRLVILKEGKYSKQNKTPKKDLRMSNQLWKESCAN